MIDLLRSRRTVRKYTDQAISEEMIETIKEAALRSPSGRNIRPWEFVFVQDPETITKLADSKEHGSKLLAGAKLAVAIISDQESTDVWVEDCSIASIIIQLTAESLGLGVCWVQIRNRSQDGTARSDEYVKSVLGVPDKYAVESIISIGHPDEQPKPHSKESLKWDKIHNETF